MVKMEEHLTQKSQNITQTSHTQEPSTWNSNFFHLMMLFSSRLNINDLISTIFTQISNVEKKR